MPVEGVTAAAVSPDPQVPPAPVHTVASSPMAAAARPVRVARPTEKAGEAPPPATGAELAAAGSALAALTPNWKVPAWGRAMAKGPKLRDVAPAELASLGTLAKGAMLPESAPLTITVAASASDTMMPAGSGAKPVRVICR